MNENGVIAVAIRELKGFVEVSPILRSGVYALVREGAVVYVGQSKNMLSRVSAHRSNWGRKSTPAWMPASIRGMLFDQVFIQPCPVDRLDRLEAEMILRYRPRYNIRIKPPTPVGPFTIHVGGIALGINRPTQPFERRI